MEILNKKQKIILIIIVGFMIIFIGYYIMNKVSESNYIELDTSSEEETNYIENDNKELEEESNQIVVHITGEVENEGIIKIEEGARISDVIENAGGVTKEADLSKINLAYTVQDGQKIYVPSINDKEEIETVTDNAGENVIQSNENNVKNERININTANQTELETLNGIGPSTALKIINYRNENGKFEKIEDIKNVPGIGDAKFENIKDNICT